MDRLVGEYGDLYEVKISDDQKDAVREQARIELGLRAFLADMADVEFVLIDEETRLRELKKELRWNEAYYHAARGL